MRPNETVPSKGFTPRVRSNLGSNAAEVGPKRCTVTQNNARRTNKIDFLQLRWAQTPIDTFRSAI